MKRAALIVTSITHCRSAQETLRVQDTVSALRRNGWSVDVLTPSRNPILTAMLDADVRVFAVPRLPLLRRLLMFLRGVAEGAGVARAVDRATVKRFAYIAEIHHPGTAGRSTVAHAAAVIVPDEATLAGFSTPPPMARVSILADPHAELVNNALTAAEFASALDGIYTYVLRIHPEIET